MKKFLLVIISLGSGLYVQSLNLSAADDIDSWLMRNAELYWDDYHCFACEVYEIRHSGYIGFDRWRIFVKDNLYSYRLWSPAECSLENYFQKVKKFGTAL